MTVRKTRTPRNTVPKVVSTALGWVDNLDLDAIRSAPVINRIRNQESPSRPCLLCGFEVSNPPAATTYFRVLIGKRQEPVRVGGICARCKHAILKLRGKLGRTA